MYSCGDFTCAYSHKKKNQLSSEGKYSADLIAVLDKHGNKDDLLRHQTRAISIDQNLQDIKAKFTSKEHKSFNATTDRYSGSEKPVSYKLELAKMFGNRDNIQQKANKAEEKEKKGGKLSDEELAAKLQAEEFKISGFKP